MQKIGYFIPEFPGQTHIFFWREISALKARGIEPELVSTRRPPRQIVSHPWALEAMAKTEYLAPPSARGIAAALSELTRTAPAGWGRCASSIARAEGLAVGGRLRLMALAVMGSRLAALARARGWTHIHAHSCADTAHTAMFASLLSGIPYSLTLHGPLSDYGPNQREKWRHARFAVVITRKLWHEVQEALSGSLPPSIEIAPMGVELTRFARRTPYEPWTGRGPLRIFSCGRLNPCKGHQDMIQALEILRARGLDARLAIAGEDEAGGTTYRKVLEAQIADRKLSHVSRLLGAVSEDRVRDELERAHVFSLASLNEPLGVAIMEAMAMRTPVVVTGAGGVPELVDDGVDGILVQPERPAELAEKIEAVAR
ncbi:MAG: exopolysaccharide biosynthesis GT4 family glycosyltransferase EpsE, partial [Byssovorax sp.]